MPSYDSIINVLVGRAARQMWLGNIDASDRRKQNEYERDLNQRLAEQRLALPEGRFKIDQIYILSDEDRRVLEEARKRRARRLRQAGAA